MTQTVLVHLLVACLLLQLHMEIYVYKREKARRQCNAKRAKGKLIS